MPKGRKENLIHPADRASEELREMTRKGGIASGKARRKKKTLREMVKAFGELGVDDRSDRKMSELGIPEDMRVRYMQGVVSLFNKANKGDVSAFNAIRDIIGEKPVDETKVTGNIATEITINLIHTGVEPVGDESEIE
jgi:hypothetical protein